MSDSLYYYYIPLVTVYNFDGILNYINFNIYNSTYSPFKNNEAQ